VKKEGVLMNNIRWLLFDWGDTLMFDNPDYEDEMYKWPQITLMSGVAETLPTITNKYQCAVVSNAFYSNADTMKKAFDRMKIDNHFKLYITSKEIGYKKPDERFFIHIADLLETPLHTLCMIGNDYEKDIRKQAIEDSSKLAATVPFEVAVTSYEILPLAEAVVKKGNSNAITDGLVAAMLARTAVLSAILNVRINLSSIDDKEFVNKYREKSDELEANTCAYEKKILENSPF